MRVVLDLPGRALRRVRALTGVSIRDRGFFLLLLLTYVISRTARGFVPTLIFAFLAVVSALCFLWTRSIHSNLNVIHDCERYRVQRGQPVNMSLRVENEGFLPVPWLVVVDETGGGGGYRETTGLSPLASLVRTYGLEQLPRGRYRPGPVTVTAGDPLGLFTTTRSYHGHRELVVYPRVVRWTRVGIPLRQPFGAFSTRDRSLEDPSSLAGIRDFRTGDNPRHIDWKATARRGAVQVRQFDLHATGSLHLVLDLWRGQEEQAFESAVEAAASLAAAALGRGLELSLLARGGVTHHLPPGRGRGQLLACLELLAAVRGDGPAPLHLILAAGRGRRSGATLCVITGHLDGPAAGQLLARRGDGPVAAFLAGDAAPAGTSRRLATAGISVFRVSPAGMPVAQEGGDHALTR